MNASHRAAAGADRIVVEGVLDLHAAHQLLVTLDEAPFDRDIRVDLSHVRELQDFAVAVLAQQIASRRERVLIAGLGRHHERLLDYLGLGRILDRVTEAPTQAG